MQVLIDDNAGFCFGVVKAIAAAEAELAEKGSLYCLGDIVHNNAEVSRLREKGLEIIDHDCLRNLRNTSVLIRAHGEPPQTYGIAEERGIRLIDATCPIVLALQQKIKKGYEEMKRVGGQVVIFGKPGHAEVIGLCGQTDDNAIVVSCPDDLEHIDFNRPIRLYSQTTKSGEDYAKLIENIKESILRECPDAEESHFVAFNTLCNRVANRAKELEHFAKQVDVLLFVGGANSSNGHYLYEYCRKVQPNTYFLSNVDELQQEWVEHAQTVGITGATSTPRWLMEALKLTIDN